MSLQCNIFCPKYTYVHTTGAIREAILRSRIPISRACHKKASQDLIFYDEPIRMDYFEVILGISTALTYMYEPHIFNTNTNTQCTAQTLQKTPCKYLASQYIQYILCKVLVRSKVFTSTSSIHYIYLMKILVATFYQNISSVVTII